MMHFMSFQSFVEKFKMKKGFTISCIRKDHRREFENVDFEDFCDNFWAEEVKNSCYILNRVLIRPSLDKTPYEL